MADDYQEDKTEKGTARRREQAREKGQVTRSRDLIAVAVSAGVLFTLYLAGRTLMEHLSRLTGDMLGLRYGRDPLAALHVAGVETVWMLMPFFGIGVVAALFSSVAQGGFVFKPLSIEFEKLNPLTGLGKLFSREGLMESGKSILKFVGSGIVFYFVIKHVLSVVPQISAMDLGVAMPFSVSLIATSVLYGLGAFLIMAAIDYLVQMWRFERSMLMTKEEIRQEYKETEGDPILKSRIKSIQREMARKRMMQEVPKATVVITNPTHLAVALQYEPGGQSAPRVVAKGAGIIAENIRELAKKHGVPLVEDKPLARALFKLKLEATIPQELYRAVAKILAYIYKLRGAA